MFNKFLRLAGVLLLPTVFMISVNVRVRAFSVVAAKEGLLF